MSRAALDPAPVSPQHDPMAVRARHSMALLLVLGCGETTRTSDAAMPTGSTDTTSAIGTATEDFPLDNEPWFTGHNTQNAELPKVSLEPERDQVIYIHLDESGRYDINMHHHFDFGAYSAVAFEARASADTELTISITTLDAQDYWEAAEDSPVWQVTTLRLSTEWAKYTIALSDLDPPTAGTPEPLGSTTGSTVHFLIDTARPIELWIDDIKLTSGAP